MQTHLGELKRRRRQPDPRKIKKHSDIVRRKAGNVLIGGSRERTDTGYIVRGFNGKTFETYFAMMLSGTATPSMLHEKKDRTIRILSGSLHVMTTDAEGKESARKAIPGDEVILERGTSYRFATSSEDVEFFVCQSAKYAATLEMSGDTGIPANVPDSLLQEPTATQRLNAGNPQTRRRRGSKAKEQLAAQRRNRKQSPIIDAPIPGREGAVSSAPERAAAATGTNPQPSMGRFSDEGAG